MTTFKQFFEEFSLMPDFTHGFNINNQISTINKHAELTYTLTEIGTHKAIKSSRSVLGKQFIYILSSGNIPDTIKSSKFLKVLPAKYTISGNITLDFKSVLIDASTKKVKQFKLKHEIVTPHIFLSNEIRGQKLPLNFYKDLLQMYPIVTDHHTVAAAKLWERVGPVTYFRFPLKGEKGLQLCDRTDSGKIWKILFSDSVKSLDDL